ncbi:MAG: O-antigen ligase family protein [Planctomycetota bacterium]
MDAGLLTIFFVLMASIAGCVAWLRFGYSAALGVAIPLTMLSATWFHLDVAGQDLDARTLAAIVMLALLAYPMGRRIIRPWFVLDWILLGIIVWHVVVDTFHSGFSVGRPFVSYAEWALPYAAGRYAMLHPHGMRWLARVLVSVGCVISLAALIEAFSGQNVWETLFLPVDDLVTRTTGIRFNLVYRAIGPTRHPIFLGILFMVILPWCVVLWEDTQLASQRGLVIAAAIFLAIGMLATVSRGPLLTTLVALVTAIAVRYPITRWPLAGVAVVMVSLAVTFQAQLLETFDSQLKGRQHSKVVVLDGEQEVFSSSRNRVFVVRIYGPLALKGGPLGYGSTATSTFPPDIPGLPASDESREILGIVDNAFILQTLRLGWMGGVLVVALFLGGIVTAFSLMRTADTFLMPCSAAVLLAMGCMLIAITLQLLIVFWAYDFAFWVLFQIGTLAGLRTRRTLALREF